MSQPPVKYNTYCGFKPGFLLSKNKSEENNTKKEVKEDKSESMFSAGNLPIQLLLHTARFLDSNSLSSFSKVDKKFNFISEQTYRYYIKPEIRDTGRSTVLFRSPQNRLDRYVPFDKIGLNYLKSIGIRNNLTIQSIKNGEMSIQEALDIRNTILQDIAVMLNNPNLSFDERSALESLGVREYVASGLITIQEAMALKGDGRRSLESAGVEKYIDNGSITIQEAMALNSDGIISLESAL